MAYNPSHQPTFQITHETQPSNQVIAGFSSFGLAGLTAVDFLVDQLELTETGYIAIDDLPAITPFTNGTPRHHTRLFSRSDVDLTVLVNELFVPLWGTDAFGKAILDWTDANEVEEITVLSGVPVAHGPEEHRVFYVASTDYQQARLADAGVPSMTNGFLDGVNASLIGRGMDTDLRVGVLITPVHNRVPDIDAALRLVQAVESLYDVDVDTAALEGFASEIESYYQELESRLESVEQGAMPEDRMFM